jgi:hypothetical protein
MEGRKLEELVESDRLRREDDGRDPEDCAINRCEETARWTVTVVGHPNVPGVRVTSYCTKHARSMAGTLWEDSPVSYKITVEGPLR